MRSPFFLFCLNVVLMFAVTVGFIAPITAAETDQPPSIEALIITGQMLYKHNWQGTTPVLKKMLEDTGIMQVDVAQTPPIGRPVDEFQPDVSKYDVLIMNYDGAMWSQKVQDDFVEFVRSGGGLVIYHEANNGFPKWKEYNEMIGLGGWNGRDERWGPMAYWQDGKIVLDHSPGKGGAHGPQTEYQVVIRDPDHSITKGLPEKWMHAKDELYATLRGPARNLHFLATAVSEITNRHEPVLFTIEYGKGRVFHTVMGHDVEQLRCVGFIVTFQRGVEWAATGKVTQTAVPEDFPTAERVSIR